jgi:hypothetical protein
MRTQDERVVVRALAGQFPIFAESTIRRWVAGESARYTSAKITTYVPVLVQRSVAATLRELSRPDGTSADALTLGETLGGTEGDDARVAAP